MLSQPLPWRQIVLAGALVLLGSIVIRSLDIEMTGLIGLMLIVLATIVTTRIVPRG